MKNTGNFSLLLGLAYITLAGISISVDFPVKVINAVSIGAVIFSISEILEIIKKLLINRHSFVDVLKKPECKTRDIIAAKYINEVLDEKKRELSSRYSLLNIMSIILKTIAIACIIIIPCIPSFSWLIESNKLGVICTFVSMGLIFISYHFSDMRESDKELNDLTDMIQCFDLVIGDNLEMSGKLPDHKKELMRFIASKEESQKDGNRKK